MDSLNISCAVVKQALTFGSRFVRVGVLIVVLTGCASDRQLPLTPLSPTFIATRPMPTSGGPGSDLVRYGDFTWKTQCLEEMTLSDVPTKGFAFIQSLSPDPMERVLDTQTNTWTMLPAGFEASKWIPSADAAKLLDDDRQRIIYLASGRETEFQLPDAWFVAWVGPAHLLYHSMKMDSQAPEEDILVDMMGRVTRIVPDYPNVVVSKRDMSFPQADVYDLYAYDLQIAIYPFARPDLYGWTVWDRQERKALLEVGNTLQDLDAVVSPNGKWIAIAGSLPDGGGPGIVVYDTASNTHLSLDLSSLDVAHGLGRKLTWSPDSQKLGMWISGPGDSQPRASEWVDFAVLDFRERELTGYCVGGSPTVVGEMTIVWSPESTAVALSSVDLGDARASTIVVNLQRGVFALVGDNARVHYWLPELPTKWLEATP